MQELTVLEEHACFGGVQGFYEHGAQTIGLPMRFGVYRPPSAGGGPGRGGLPVLYYLAGLTCNEQTFAIKAGAQRHAAQHGLLLVTPDTSPRNTGIAEAEGDWEFGTGAGFYLDACVEPYARHWRMETYLTEELPAVMARHFGADAGAAGIFGHSMGGHGALTLALRHPGRYRSVSALAPICAPTEVPWGQKAFRGYLGTDQARWAEHDATQLVMRGARAPDILLDQGLSDQFLATQLRPERLEQACAAAGQPLTLRRHEGYDHGYFFVASFMAAHVAYHARVLRA